jgi:uncharacterized protein
MSPHAAGPLPVRPGARLFAPLLLTLACSTLWGCASDYVARTDGVRSAYQGYQYDNALERLEAEDKRQAERDRLLVLLDKGMVLHASGRFAESNQVLAEAEKLSAQLEVLSVSEEAVTLFANERERAYRGEDFEKLMINVVKALNFSQLGDHEAALVEVRRVDLRLRKMVDEEKKPYQQLAIARYLGGVIREDQRDWDSAFIDYLKAWELEPNLSHLGEPLVRLAKKLDRAEYEKLKAAFPGADERPLGAGEGELVVVVEAGLSPQKQSATQNRNGGQLIAIPTFRDRGAPGRATVRVGEVSRTTVTVTNVRAVAKLHLDDRVGRILARGLASTALKAGVAAGAGALTRSEELGVLAFYLMTLSNQPDLRSWLSLPAEFQLARLRLPAGTHTVSIDSGGKTTEHPVTIEAGRVAVLPVRRY